MALTTEQLILLDNLIYLDYIASDNTYDSTVKSKVDYLLDLPNEEFEAAITDEQFYYCDNMVNGMNADQWKNVLNAIASDEELMNMKITNVQDDNDYTGGDDEAATGFRAA